MKNLIPKRSILGFKILSSWSSIYSSYFLLIFFYMAAPNFGEEYIEKIAGNLFLLIMNGSLLILTFNSLYQKNKRPLIIWLILSIPLWILIPTEIRIILYVLKSNLFP